MLLLSELKRRFRKYTDPGDASHDPIFLMATALDPRYRLILNPTQLARAKEAILKQVCVHVLQCLCIKFMVHIIMHSLAIINVFLWVEFMPL